MAQLEIRNVTRRIGDLVVVDNISLDIEAGKFFTLLGPSGCGEFTLLRMIAGFDLPDAGQIVLDGIDLADTLEKRPVRTVFQSYALFLHMTVAQNIAFPLKMSRRPPEQARIRLQEALEQVRLTGKAGKYPHELSGGEKQRVGWSAARSCCCSMNRWRRWMPSCVNRKKIPHRLQHPQRRRGAGAGFDGAAQQRPAP